MMTAGHGSRSTTWLTSVTVGSAISAGPPPLTTRTGARAPSTSSHGAAASREQLRSQTRFTELGGVAAARRLLDESPDTSAIFAGSPAQAAGAIYVAWERGLRVPQDFSIIGFTDALSAEVTLPPLTTVSMPLEELGAVGLRELLKQRHTGVARDVVLETKPEIILRQSTGPARAPTSGPGSPR